MVGRTTVFALILSLIATPLFAEEIASKSSTSSETKAATAAAGTGSAPHHVAITELQLQAMVNKLRGDDDRLMRWDITDHTEEQQNNGGCDHLEQMFDIILSPSQRKDNQDGISDSLKILALEYVTFCVTDNPYNRYIFSEVRGPKLHKSVIKLVHSPNSELSAMASHVIYITTFANRQNQHTYFEHGAVTALGDVIKNEMAATFTAAQTMWAAAALQNLAATYCNPESEENNPHRDMEQVGPEEGEEEDNKANRDNEENVESISTHLKHAGGTRCWWDWTMEEEHIVIQQESLPILSDGSAIRQAILNDDELMDVLKMLACRGPVKGTPSDYNIFISDNAISGRDDNNPAIIPWAAIGVLKNIVLEGPAAKEYVESIMMCLCHTYHSPDWLESNKGQDIMYHIRRADPCWFYEEEDYFSVLTCIDYNFLDEDGYACDAYENASEEECAAQDRFNKNLTAEMACCECGGGQNLQHLHDFDDNEDEEEVAEEL